MTNKCAWMVTFMLLTAGGLAQAAPGDLDLTFGGTGLVSPLAGGGQDVAVQKDGKIVMPVISNLGGVDFRLVRHNPDGSPDEAFNANGHFSEPSQKTAVNILVQPDGKILAGGAVITSAYNGALFRFNADGTPDRHFGNRGVATGLSTLQSVYTVALQADNKILAAGFDWAGSVARLNADGSPDGTFGQGGVAYIPVAEPFVWKILVQPDGKIVAAGSASNDHYAMVARFNADGTLDAGFATGGVFLYQPAYPFSNAQFMGGSLQADGKIVGVGSVLTSLYTPLVIRVNPDGSLDPGFGAGGIVTGPAPPGPYGIYPCDIGIQRDGRIVVSGSGDNGVAIRYGSDGSLDLSFGTDGWVAIPGNTGNQANGVDIQPDGKIVLELNDYYDMTCVARLLGQDYPSAQVNLPNGGETIKSQSTYHIWWGAPPAAKTFSLAYSTDAGARWTAIASGIAMAPYGWTVPRTNTNRNTCLVKVTAFDEMGNFIGEDISDSFFTITK